MAVGAGVNAVWFARRVAQGAGGITHLANMVPNLGANVRRPIAPRSHLRILCFSPGPSYVNLTRYRGIQCPLRLPLFIFPVVCRPHHPNNPAWHKQGKLPAQARPTRCFSYAAEHCTHAYLLTNTTSTLHFYITHNTYSNGHALCSQTGCKHVILFTRIGF